MTQHRKLPIEPLSDRAWTAIREEVFAELDAASDERARSVDGGEGARWRRIAAWSAAAAVAASVLAAIALRSDQPAPLATTSRIATSGNVTRATIGDATAEVAPESALLVTGNESAGFTVVLERGEVAFSVPKRGERAPFRVHAGDVRVEVVGTRFTVSRQDDRVHVRVAHGSVRVASRGEVVVLRQGGHWNSAEPSRPAAAAPRSSEPAPPPQAAAPAPDDSASGASPSAGRIERVAARDRAPSRRAMPATRRSAPEAKASPAVSARARYEAASQLEASEPDRAIELYLQLADGGGSWAANALYAAGRLQLERGRRDAARALLQRYLLRFPTGPNAEEARSLLERSR